MLGARWVALGLMDSAVAPSRCRYGACRNSSPGPTTYEVAQVGADRACLTRRTGSAGQRCGIGAPFTLGSMIHCGSNTSAWGLSSSRPPAAQVGKSQNPCQPNRDAGVEDRVGDSTSYSFAPINPRERRLLPQVGQPSRARRPQLPPVPRGPRRARDQLSLTRTRTLPTAPCSTASCAAAVCSSGNQVSGSPACSPTGSAPSMSAAVMSSTAACRASAPTV